MDLQHKASGTEGDVGAKASAYRAYLRATDLGVRIPRQPDPLDADVLDDTKPDRAYSHIYSVRMVSIAGLAVNGAR